MKTKYIFLNAGLRLWSLSLVAWFCSALLWTLVFTSLTFVSFIIHVIHKRVFIVFRKEKSAPPATVSHQTEKTSSVQEPQIGTVIASDVHFEGNITANGQVDIYGEVHGNIFSHGGLVKIMRNGRVKGNITGGTLAIDGTLIGEGKSESVDIHEYGKVDGSLTYTTLSVKKGGYLQVQRKPSRTRKKKSTLSLLPRVKGRRLRLGRYPVTPPEQTD